MTMSGLRVGKRNKASIVPSTKIRGRAKKNRRFQRIRNQGSPDVIDPLSLSSGIAALSVRLTTVSGAAPNRIGRHDE